MNADPRKAVADALIAALTDSGIDWSKIDVELERTGKRIILPAEPIPMPIPAAIEHLGRVQKDEEQELNVEERIMAHPLEAAVAFVAAMKAIYGWVGAVPKREWWGMSLPTFLSIQVGVDEWIQVPWGSFRLPNVENPVNVSVGSSGNNQFMRITGTVRKREKQFLLDLAIKTREILKEHSIYRGKAIHLTTDESGSLNMNNPPSFMDLRNVVPEELIMNRDVEEQLNTNVLVPIMYTDECRDMEIPLHRGILTEGRYGVGKTMAARIIAKVCSDGGKWTFISIDRPQSLAEGLRFAERYQPCVVAVEDIDRAMEERDEEANDLLNTISGILSNNADVIVMLTTNHVDKIHQAMLRPGRLDAVITMAPPDADSVQRLIQLYSRGLIAPGETLDEIGEMMAGNIPAVVREMVERSKLSMIGGRRSQLVEHDFVVAANGMKAHLALLAPKEEKTSVEENVGRALGSLIEKITFGENDGEIDTETFTAVKRIQGDLRRSMAILLEGAENATMAAASGGKDIAVIRKKVDKIHDVVV